MSDSFVDGFSLKLEPYFTPEQIRQIKEMLYIYTLGFTIVPITTELAVTEYCLPQAYHVYIASKEQDGKLSLRSREQYCLCIEDMLYFLRIPLDAITVNHIRMYLQHISVNRKTGKKLSAETMNQRKSIIKSFFRWLYEEEYIAKDPSVRIKREKAHSKPREQYEDTDIEKIRDACMSERDIAIVDLLASSGIRVSECVGLNIEDIDLENRELVVYGKGGKWRTAYIDARAVVSIRKYLDSRTDDCEALFVSKKKPFQRIGAPAVRRCLHSLSFESGVQNIIPHRFRHTVATRAIEKDMPVESVQAMLGHMDIKTTMHYAHVNKEKVKADHRRYIGK